MPAWRVFVMPVSGAQQASVHEMLQAAVHSIYIRLGSGPTSSDRTVGSCSRLSGSLSGQSPQNFEPPAFRSARSDDSVSPVQMAETLDARVAEHAMAVRIRAAAHHAAVAEHHQRAPRPGALKPGRQIIQ